MPIMPEEDRYRDIITYWAIGVIVLSVLLAVATLVVRVPFEKENGGSGTTSTDGVELIVPQDGIKLSVPPEGIALRVPPEGIRVDLGDKPIRVDLSAQPVEVVLGGNSPEAPLFVEAMVGIDPGEIVVNVPEDTINVEAVLPQGAVMVEVPEPKVETRVIVQQIPAKDVTIVDGSDPIPTIKSNHYTVSFPRFQPLATRSEGLELPSAAKQWLKRFRTDIENCGRVKVTVSGGASPTDFVDPEPSENVWKVLRYEIKKKDRDGPSMDDLMNCGLANMRSIAAAKELAGGIKPKTGASRDVWDELMDSAEKVMDDLKRKEDVRLGNQEEAMLDRSRRIFGSLKDLCRSEKTNRSVGNLQIKLVTYGLSDGEFTSRGQSAQIALKTENGQVGSCNIGGRVIADAIDTTSAAPEDHR